MEARNAVTILLLAYPLKATHKSVVSTGVVETLLTWPSCVTSNRLPMGDKFRSIRSGRPVLSYTFLALSAVVALAAAVETAASTTTTNTAPGLQNGR